MGKTTNITYTNQNVAFIPTAVTYDIPRDGVPHTIRVPLENYSDQINIEIPDDGVTIANAVLKNRGIEMDVTVDAGVALGNLPLIVISPGGYTNENLSGDLANNATNRINIIETGGSLTVKGNDSIDLYSDLVALESLNPPLVEDELQRDLLYPAPPNDFEVFNRRIESLERYDATFGLWLSSTTIVCVTNNLDMVDKRIVYVNGAFDDGSGEKTLVNYPTTGLQADNSIGVVVEIGNDIGTPRTHKYVAVATRGQYYVNNVEPLLAGEEVSARVSGTGSDTGQASNDSGSTGIMGFCLQNSGSNPDYPSSVLINIGLIAEYY
jgi:hypothetical protein